MKKIIVLLIITLFITTFSYGGYATWSQYGSGHPQCPSVDVTLLAGYSNHFIISADAYLSEGGTGCGASAWATIYYMNTPLNHVGVGHCGTFPDPPEQKNVQAYYVDPDAEFEEMNNIHDLCVTRMEYRVDVEAPLGVTGFALVSLTWW